MRAAALLALMASVLSGIPTQEDRAERGEHSRTQAAIDVVRRTETATLADQVRLCEVPAPPFGERARAEVVRDMLDAAGLRNVRRDREGNVVGEWPGRSARPHLVLTAHLDTVFPEGTPVRVTREGSQLRGPGIGDN